MFSVEVERVLATGRVVYVRDINRKMSTQTVVNPLSQKYKGRAHMPGLAVPSNKRTDPPKKVCS